MMVEIINTLLCERETAEALCFHYKNQMEQVLSLQTTLHRMPRKLPEFYSRIRSSTTCLTACKLPSTDIPQAWVGSGGTSYEKK